MVFGTVCCFTHNLPAQEINNPPNSYVLGNQWYCNTGFKQVGQKCEEIIKPPNSYVLGNQWYCNTGFKKSGEECLKMTAEEAEQQRIQIEIMVARARIANREFFIDGERFTLNEISKNCEVYRYSDNYGDVECRNSRFREVERKCEAYFPDEDDENGDIECRGSELRPIERGCSASMYSDDYGDISC